MIFIEMVVIIVSNRLIKMLIDGISKVLLEGLGFKSLMV